MTHSSVPDSTAAPLAALMEATLPSQGHMISFSIFMASKIISTSPFFTEAPWLTFTSRMVPGCGQAGGGMPLPVWALSS